MKPINKIPLENSPHPTLSHEERAKDGDLWGEAFSIGGKVG